MTPSTTIAVDDATSLSLPCYLAHKRHLPLLLRLLREGGLSLSACGASADDLWPHLQLAEDELPVLCELLEHLASPTDVKEPVSAEASTAASTEEAEPEAKANTSAEVTVEDEPYALPSAAFTKWLSANPSLLAPLATELLNDPQLEEALADTITKAEAAAKAAAEAKAMSELVKSLCEQPAADARAYVEKNTDTPQLIRVAVHHGFLDLIHRFVPCKYDRYRYVCTVTVTAPTCSVDTPYSLSLSGAANAWMWLMKGDGDLDHKVWAAMVAADLVTEPGDAYRVIAGALKHQNTLSLKQAEGMESVLHGAVSRGDAVVAKYLLNVLKTPVNACNSNGDTALHVAAGGSNPDIVRVLLQAGANINAQDSQKRTVLHLATDVSVAKLLVERGASLVARNASGLTPYDGRPRGDPVALYLRALNVMKAHH
jgi:hypothetical protein